MKNHGDAAHFLFTLLFFMAALVVIVLVGGSDEASGKTWSVDADGGADYEKIQDAINASENGDTVKVWEGAYYENVAVNRSINLIGNGSGVTTVDGDGSGIVVRIMADWVNMSGFTVTGSGRSGYPDYDSAIKVESNHCRVFNTNCSNNDDGISLFGSRACKIENNTCSTNNEYGIYLSSSSTCTITNNTCENNDDGISLVLSSDCTITNNTMNENSIFISGNLENWNSHTVETTNTVNGKTVHYYKDVTGYTVPYGAGQVILANCTWIDVVNQNCSNGSVGILVGYSSHITITNSTCSANNEYSIFLWDSNDCKIENNTCSANNGYGIFLWDSSECTITNNTCLANNDDGIFLWESSDCKIMNNTCSENNHSGIALRDSNNCKITNNTCSENNGHGIYLLRSCACKIENSACSANNNDGINLWYSSDCSIENNTCLANNDDGINLWYSNDCTIENNICLANNRYGINLSHSSIILGLLGALLLLALLSLFVFMGKSPREKRSKPPVGNEKSGGVDEGSQE